MDLVPPACGSIVPLMDIGSVVHYYDCAEGAGGHVVELAAQLAVEHRVMIYSAGVRTPPRGAAVSSAWALRGSNPGPTDYESAALTT